MREYSARFDGWAPDDFLLTPEAIDRIVASVPAHVIADIRTVQQNVRSFAQLQLESMHEFEVETAPGVHLGQRHLPMSAAARTCPAAGTRSSLRPT